MFLAKLHGLSTALEVLQVDRHLDTRDASEPTNAGWCIIQGSTSALAAS